YNRAVRNNLNGRSGLDGRLTGCRKPSLLAFQEPSEFLASGEILGRRVPGPQGQYHSATEWRDNVLRHLVHHLERAISGEIARLPRRVMRLPMSVPGTFPTWPDQCRTSALGGPADVHYTALNGRL